MKSGRALAAATLVALLTLSAAVVHASPARVRVLVGVSRWHGWGNARAVLELFGRVEGEIPEIGTAVLSLPRSAVERVKVLTFVEYVEEDAKLELATTYTDTVHWNVRMINATAVWSAYSGYGNAAQGYHAVVQVAVLDTGVDYTHRDLFGSVAWCVVSLGGGSTFYRGYDLARCADPRGHGTLVAGIIAARLNSWGMAGAAPKVVLYAVRVIDSSGTIYVSDVARGIVEAVKGPDGVVGTEDDADVISMSFGGGRSTTLYNAVRYAYDNGAVLVAAAGNSGASTPVYPAAYPEVIAVGAVDRYYAVPSWSNRNPDVVAPGSTVVSTYPGDRHVAASGTSIACPHVSAAVALVQALRLAAGMRKLAPAQAIELVRATAIDLGATGYDALYGYGLLDAYAAVTRGLGIG